MAPFLAFPFFLQQHWREKGAVPAATLFQVAEQVRRGLAHQLKSQVEKAIDREPGACEELSPSNFPVPYNFMLLHGQGGLGMDLLS